ncbi:MAG TPA: DUF192 domain-containing protein [Actinomycetota bacterium]|nr:DUF192 domain-containing protein [Actinomycetota bacterium]
MPFRLVVPRTGRVVAHRIVRASTAVDRARGLLGREPLAEGEALLLEPARQVHTFGMSYDLDVCFCDRRWRVARVVRSMPPRRLTRWVLRAHCAIEMRAGGFAGVGAGDQLSLEELSER